MTDQNPQEPAADRKPYRKPEAVRVPLRPEEAVLGACKIASGSGPGGACGLTCVSAGS